MAIQSPGFRLSVNGNWVYGYDDFNRLVRSNKNSGQQTFTYEYDRFGNRLFQNAPQGGPAPQYNFDVNNRITSPSGVVTDAAGNITNDGLGHSYTYDAENRLVAVDGGATASYIYDARGRRVQRTLGSTRTDLVYDPAGGLVLDINPTTQVQNRWEISALGRSLATYVNSTTVFNHSDWLGTVRAHSDVTGASVQTCTGLAFSDPTALSCTGSGVNSWSPIHFTGDEHDAETNLEHAWFRQYSGTQGRWLTPDPAGLAAVDPASPQTWNRYAYVANNPVNAVDPKGLRMNLACPAGWCGGGGGFWGDVTYMIDGMEVSPGFAMNYLENGSGLICPSGNCAGYGTEWRLSTTGDHYMLNVDASSTTRPDPNNPLSETISQNAGWADLGPVSVWNSMVTADAAGYPHVPSVLDYAEVHKQIVWPAPTSGRQVINGIEYGEHALARMAPVGTSWRIGGGWVAGRGVPPSVVENAIQWGSKIPGNLPGTVVHIFENVQAVTNSAWDFVITVIKTGH